MGNLRHKFRKTGIDDIFTEPQAKFRRVGRGEEGFPWILSAHKQKSEVSFLALTVVLPSLSPDEDQGLLLAAAYVSDAQYNRNVPFETSPRAIR